MDLSPYRHLYPFESHWLDIQGHRYHYVDEGAGEPVILVHGNPTWSFFFRGLIIALREAYRVIAVDHIGCGLSDVPGDADYEYCLERRVADLDALVEHLQLGDNLTFGIHDWGGMIGMACALRQVRRVKRLMVFNTAAFGLPRGKTLPVRLWIVRNLTTLATPLVRGLNAFSYLATHMACVKRMSADVSQAYRAPYDSWATRIATLRFVQDIPLRPGDRSYDLVRWVEDHLHQLRDVPMLICWGERDVVFDAAFLAGWRTRFPAAVVHTFPDAGHYVLEDVGAQIYPLVHAFLDAHPPSQVASMSRVRSSRNQVPARGGTVNIAEQLTAMAGRYPDKRAVVWTAGRDGAGRARYAHVTFMELDQETDRYAHGLERVGITRGTRTIVFVAPGLDFFALVFALFKIGAVPVIVDPGVGRQQMRRCLSEVQGEAFIGVPRAHVFRMLYPGAFRSVRVAVTVGRRWCWGGLRLADIRTDPWRSYDPAPTRESDPAAILFTSGSTGPAKGVLYEHGMFDAQVRYLSAHFGYSAAEVDLPTFPLFALFDAALGLTAVIPDMDFTCPGAVDPRKIIQTIGDHGVTHMFGSPALLDRVSRYGEANGTSLPTLTRVITAGAPVSPLVLERMHTMLGPEAEVHTPYGATEALPVSSIGSREILRDTAKQTRRGAGMCVGTPMPGLDVRIIRIDDAPIADWSDGLELPMGDIGEITVSGAVVTRTYHNNPGATAMAKIAHGGSIRHRMGDVGYVDEVGRLWFCGRKAHRVVTQTRTLFTVPCEAIFNRHPRVYRSALVGLGEPGRQRPVICIQLEDDDTGSDQAGLTRELLRRATADVLTRDITTVLFHSGFPVDARHNSKIAREKLAVWAAEQVR